MKIPFFKVLVKEITDDATKRLSDYTFLPKEERNTLVHTFNNTHKDYPSNKTIPQLFEEQVKKTPKNIACVFEWQVAEKFR